ncbi:hypothetical protein MNB_SV-5-9 [hydrothermal vent metagenome]|uniref:Uncharacterized protein n=1 Tax=hydrothermal vent metagenome TaxID=652676 RepID=A0A1W1EE99_9ZZZZ
MKTFKLCVILSIFLLSSSFLSAQTESGNNSSNKNETQSTKLLSSIIIIRPANIQGKAINIYIDGEYVSSLLPGSYTQESVCPTTHRIKAAYTNIKTRYKEKQSAGQRVKLNAGKEYFYRVGNKLKIHPLSENERKALFAKHPKEQTYTISRLNKKRCSQPSRNIKNKSSRGD